MAKNAVMQPMKPDGGGIAVQRPRFETQNYDHKGIIVVASAWLLFYGLMFSGLTFRQAANVLAAFY
jgi:hypothetical protein